MSYGLERLKEIGAQKIHERTHIAREHVQAILHESFDGLNKIHFLGFISILEREYDVDLNELKEKGLTFFKNNEDKSRHVNNTVFAHAKKKNSNALFYILLVALLAGAYLYFKVTPSMNENASEQQIDNTIIENVQKTLEPMNEKDNNDSNESNETNQTVAMVHENNSTEQNSSLNSEVTKIETHKKEAPSESKSLTVLPKAKVWMGYIDINSSKKYTKNLEVEKFEIDATHNWLFLFGHGSITIEVNGKTQEFSSQQNMRFKYVDGNFSAINIEEFMKLNKDKKW